MTRVVGIGRLCIDVHLSTSEDFRRFDSTKCAAKESRFFGGSVPRILSEVACSGIECQFVGPGGYVDSIRRWLREQLVENGVDPCLLATNVPHSYILYGAGSKVRQIVSVTEQPQEILSANQIEGVLARSSFDWLVTDARHLPAAEHAARVARERSAGVLLDPGSTIGVKNLAGDGADLLYQSTMICADELTLVRIAGQNRPPDAARSLVADGLEIVVSTDSEGRAELFGRGLHVKARQLDARITGSSIGVGDTFRGWLLATLLNNGYRPGEKLSPELAATCLRYALAAAMARKATTGIEPSPLSIVEVSAFLDRAEARDHS